jgi:ribose 5-phosphate isomerase B
MKIAIDADTNGAALKKALLEHLKGKGIDVTDLDYLSGHQQDDYPDVAVNLAVKIKEKEFDRGILICGTGLGVAMSANKVPGVFAGTCNDVYSAERLMKSNNAQVITLGAQVLGIEAAKVIVDAYLASEFQGGRSLPKVDRMREIDRINFGAQGT